MYFQGIGLDFFKETYTHFFQNLGTLKEKLCFWGELGPLSYMSSTNLRKTHFRYFFVILFNFNRWIKD